ncbi:hypothetical protein [Citrobacter amalonaticus]|uniref:hypothetical protein n=1 Tax=Citrobacter amalonaticus TaxID=35703 RepID=UPI003B5AB96C
MNSLCKWTFENSSAPCRYLCSVASSVIRWARVSADLAASGASLKMSKPISYIARRAPRELLLLPWL